MKPPALTPRQADVLDFIVRFAKSTGFPPTLREIGTALGMKSTNGVSEHLQQLENKGYLWRDVSKSRAMRVLRLPTNVLRTQRAA